MPLTANLPSVTLRPSVTASPRNAFEQFLLEPAGRVPLNGLLALQGLAGGGEPVFPYMPCKEGAYIYGGRGGAGNYRRYKVEEITPGATATGPASRISLSKLSKRQPIHTGRGGAGNVATDTEERVFQFDEEMLKKRELQAPVYIIGRGGAGNVSCQQPRTERMNSTASALSSGSDGSESDSNAKKSESAFSKIARRFS